MADLVQTAANVAPRTNCGIELVTAGEAITQGQPVYRSSAESKYYLADADTETMAEALGIAVTPASADGDRFVVARNRSGADADIELGATLSQGETYVVSSNVGKIAPVGDLTTGDYVTYLGTASSASVLKMRINATGVSKP
jgi:hypothetical protein